MNESFVLVSVTICLSPFNKFASLTLKRVHDSNLYRRIRYTHLHGQRPRGSGHVERDRSGDDHQLSRSEVALVYDDDTQS